MQHREEATGDDTGKMPISHHQSCSKFLVRSIFKARNAIHPIGFCRFATCPQCYCTARQRGRKKLNIEDTIKYINDKTKGATYSGGGAWMAIDSVELEGSKLFYIFRIQEDAGETIDGNITFRVVGEKIDLHHVSDLTESGIKEFDDNYIRLYCHDSHAECVWKKICYENDKTKCVEGRESSLFINIGGLHFKDQERVRRAMVHLKSFFPFKQGIDPFDKE